MMRFALFMSVCEGEYEMARDAICSVIAGRGEHVIDVFLVDDASPSHVGQSLAKMCLAHGLNARCLVLDEGLGFRGCARRTVLGMRFVAKSGTYDLVIKMDPDALVLRTDLCGWLAEHCVMRAGIWGMVSGMRFRQRLIWMLDMLPVGFRRRKVASVIQRNWELRRYRPVWWFPAGWRGLLRGFRFQFPGGGFYIVGGETISMLLRCGFLDLPYENRHGLIASEEDITMTILSTSVGHPIGNLNADGRWGNLKIDADMAPRAMVDSGLFVVHALKNRGAQRWQREGAMDLISAGWSDVALAMWRCTAAAAIADASSGAIASKQRSTVE